MQKAQVPQSPTRSRTQFMLLGAFLGLALGILLSLLQEYLDDRINSIDEAERLLQLPSLGLIPVIEEEGLRKVRAKTFSPITEAYRSLRSNMNFASVDSPLRTLMITSTSPGEGKSMTASNLATVVAMDGKRVILVDADLRRPTVHKLFNINKTPGLTDVLVGTHTISEVIKTTSIPNVSVITAGTQAPNPAELLGSEAMAHFVEAIKELADFVLFDAPPTLAVSDPVLLSARMDGVLFVISIGETKKGGARQGLSLLARARSNVLGTVLNKLDLNGQGYYGRYYSSYSPTQEEGDGEFTIENSVKPELNDGNQKIVGLPALSNDKGKSEDKH